MRRLFCLVAGLLLLPWLPAFPQEKSEVWWSLRPIAKPSPPPIKSEKFAAWPRNPIDQFVLAKMLEKKLEPGPEADRRTLLRRLTFDLTGLPPTPQELDAFLKDKGSDAYEKVVDRLLASPRLGERWARHWMDVIHFAETHGHDQDVPRPHAWPYRDYLIQSFNDDKPYGRFVEEQIAGDVLFPEDGRAVAALGFLAAGPWDESSLKDIREDTLDRKAGQYLDRDDMIGTVSLAFLSSTVQCARCHDHKFDPIPQEEYYALQAVFAGVDRANRLFDVNPKISAQRRLLTQRKKALESPVTAAKLVKEPGVVEQIAAWEKVQQKTGNVWKPLDPDRWVSQEGATLGKQSDGSILSGGKKPERDVVTIEAPVDLATITALRLEVLTDPSLPQQGPGRQDNGNLHLNEVEIEVISGEKNQGNDVPHSGKKIAIAQAVADFNQQGWEIDRAFDNNKGTAWGIHPAVGKPHQAVFIFKEPVPAPAKARLLVRLHQIHGGGHLIGRARLAVTDRPGVGLTAPLPPQVAKVLAKPMGQRTPTEQAELAIFVLRGQIDSELAALPPPQLVYAAAAEFQGDGSFRPAQGCRPIHMLKRGDVRKPGKETQPGTLSMVAGLEATFKLDDPKSEGQRRAALACWTSSPKNPLTWRSIANRLWHYHFGRGIVATPSDFGKMGGLPSHPELLDYLSLHLLENGGSLKKLHRLIVTSATYRQAVRHDAEFAKVDADNQYLWRANRQRLDAESLRDAMLQIAGKLDLTMGGPSVKHFKESPGIHRTPNADYLKFDPDAPGAHRRSVYRFIFRTVPDPFLNALDCPDASQFTAQRAVSVTALQALALLNDPFVVRMSEHTAKHLEKLGEVPDQVRHLYHMVLLRAPTARELKLMTAYAQRHGPANACRVLFNSNEFVFVN